MDPGRRTARSVTRALALVVLAAVALAALAGTALGDQSRPYTGVSFGPDGVGGSESFTTVRGLAVDRTNGDLYVFDVGREAIFKFDAAGAPANFSGSGTNAITGVSGAHGSEDELAVAPAGAPVGTAGDIYLADNATVKVFAPSGEELGSLGEGETCGVATDPAGHVFVGSYSETITEYLPTANQPYAAAPVGSPGIVPGLGLCNVAADGLGQVFAVNFGGARLARLASLGDAAPTLVEPAGSSLAVAPSDNHLFVDAGDEVFEYDSTGNPLASFGTGRLTESVGVATSANAEKVYASTGSGGKVAVFGAVAVVPGAVAAEATEVKVKKATLHGSVNPSGLPVTECSFEYFSGEGAATSVPCEGEIPTDESSHPVEATVAGLEPDTTYTFRLVATNANGEKISDTATFTTRTFAATKPATGVTREAATLNGTVTPEGSTVEACTFEYARQAAYEKEGLAAAQTVSCAQTPGEIGTGAAPVPVDAEISGLSPGENVHFRLKATVAGSPSFGAEEALLLAGPLLEAVNASDVGATEAQLFGQFNPHGEEDTYLFEYVSEAEFAAGGWDEASQAPVGGANAPALDEPVQVAETVKGLAPRTTYRFRLLVVSPAGSVTSTESVFTTFSGDGAFGLADQRAYEQASPVEKNGNSIQGAPNIVEAAAHGARVTFYVGGAIPGSESATDLPTFMSSRTAEGWTTKGILPPRSTGPRGTVKGWNEDLSRVYSSNFFLGGLVTGTLYEANTATGSKRTLASGRPELSPFYVGSSGDGSVMAFEEAFQAEPSESVWSEADGQVHLASVLNDGSLPTEGAVAGPYNWFNDPNGFNGGVQGTYYVRAEHALSNDGGRFYFTSVASHAVYLRTNPAAAQSAMNGSDCSEAARACTTEVTNGEAAAFIGATADGASALVLSKAKLTADATTGPADEGTDLYLYDAAAEELTDLTVDEEAGDPSGAEVVGVLGYSSDMSSVYFVANGTLASGGSKGTCTVSNPQRCNLYRWHEGAISFVGELEGGEDADQTDWKPVSGVDEKPPAGQVSADGNTVLFSSVVDQETGESGRFAELYRYSVGSGDAICVSCAASGAQPRGSASVTAQVPPNVPPKAAAPVRKRNLVDDGDRVFFDSPDRLVESDVNGVNDVYEWEAAGAGTCSPGQASGCVSLISSGTNPLPSYFADSDESGENVFFFTSQPLVAQDGDELVDVYDARENGGLESQNYVPPAICGGLACKGPALVPAPVTTPGSSTFVGPGNPPAKKKKPKKKHHGKKHHGKKHRHGKHHGKRAKKHGNHGEKGGGK